jgi:hypothetical protein
MKFDFYYSKSMKLIEFYYSPSMLCGMSLCGQNLDEFVRAKFG